MKIMFIVCGEGRGHLTQCLSLKELYEEAGHEICCVIVGHNRKRGSIPEFFRNAFKCRVIETASPNFAFNKDQGVCLWKTIVKNSCLWWRFVITYLRIKNRIKKHQPDTVVNFYESIFGLYRLLGGKCSRSIAIGHQFMFLHPDYVSNKDKDNKFSMFFAKQFTKLIGCGSEKIALSITQEKDAPGITVVPPILRKKVFEGNVANDGFILLYSLGKGFGKDLLMNQRQIERIEVFTEKFWPGENKTVSVGNVIFNQLDGEKFLNYMKRCDMVVCTAGFETASEAAYLGKKIMMIPTPNHIEQYYNAWDFQLAELSKIRRDFIDIHLWEMEVNKKAVETFRKWVDSYRERLKNALKI